MNTIQESPEHHFLTFLEKIKSDAGGWTGFHCALSEKMLHEDIITVPEHIESKLKRLQLESDAVAGMIAEGTKDDPSAHLYRFTDSDLVLLSRPSKDSEREKLQSLCRAVEGKVGKDLCRQHNLAKDLYDYHKMADARLLSAARVKAYMGMADGNKVSSLPVRRDRHLDPVILVVEDDRFTASYAANILNKDYDIVLAKTGEEAITFYVDHAPDIVFLDIHLPGLCGIDTLRALRKIDPAAFVIMLSVDTVKNNIVDASQGGAAGFLKKPFSKERLHSAVLKSPFVKKIKSRAVV